ncbi:MAG: hypothetical protein R3Y29_00600 [bacterium]
MSNKKINKNFIIGTQIFLSSIISMSVIAFATQAGSAEDPLVTKSYVDAEIKKALEDIIIGDIVLEDIIGDIKIDNNFNSFVPVLVEANQAILGKEGTEIILRSGSGVSIVPEGVSEIANITAGKNVFNNETVETNHLLIISRDDGRGVKVSVNSWFLVKGDYVIKN